MLCFAGLVSTFPFPYLRICCPRKSNPLLTWIVLVFSDESSRPRSARNSSITGFTSCSSWSCDRPVIRMSSANLTRWTRCLSLHRLVGNLLRRAVSNPSSVIFVSTGEHTPPTMLQTAPCGARFKRELIYPEHNIHLAFLDLHSLDQGPNNVTLAVPVGLIQSIFDFQGEVFQPTDDRVPSAKWNLHIFMEARRHFAEGTLKC